MPGTNQITIPGVIDYTDRITNRFGSWAPGGPAGIVIHHTSGTSADGAIATLNERRLASNYLVDVDGSVYQLLPDGSRGAHILPSQINDLTNANTIGIEVVAPDAGHVTAAEHAATQRLIGQLVEEYNISPQNVFGHGEVNPGHKEVDEGLSDALAIRDPGWTPPGLDLAQDQGWQPNVDLSLDNDTLQNLQAINETPFEQLALAGGPSGFDHTLDLGPQLPSVNEGLSLSIADLQDPPSFAPVSLQPDIQHPNDLYTALPDLYLQDLVPIGSLHDAVGVPRFLDPAAATQLAVDLPFIDGPDTSWQMPGTEFYNPAPNENVLPTPIDTFSDIQGPDMSAFPGGGGGGGQQGEGGDGGADAGGGQISDFGGGLPADQMQFDTSIDWDGADFNQAQWDTGLWGYDAEGNWVNWGALSPATLSRQAPAPARPSYPPEGSYDQSQIPDDYGKQYVPGLSVPGTTGGFKINPWLINNSGLFYNAFYDRGGGDKWTSPLADTYIAPSSFNPNVPIAYNEDVPLSMQLATLGGGASLLGVPAGFRLI